MSSGLSGVEAFLWIRFGFGGTSWLWVSPGSATDSMAELFLRHVG